MLILVEGTDGAGKTTLVAAVADALRIAYPHDVVEVRKCGPPTPSAHPLDLYAEPLYDYRPGCGRHIIYDRHFIGEWIYPEVLGRPSRADVPSWRWLNIMLAARGALLVHAVADLETLADNLERRGDDLVRVSQLRRISLEYETVLKQATLESHVVRFGDPLAVSDIITRARIAEARAGNLTRFITYVGPPRPRYLLLGEVRHAIGRYATPAREAILTSPELTRSLGPAFGPYPGTSGHYLLQNVPQPLLDAGLGLANACDVDDPVELWEALGRPHYAVLGRGAERAVRSRMYRYGVAPHPQYWRRFYSAYGDHYGTLIKSALEGADVSTYRPDDSWSARARS